MTLDAISQALGAFWPYAVVVVFGFLPTEIWRVFGVLLGKGMGEESEAIIFVRMVAAGLVAAVVAKLLISPIGALANVPVGVRMSAVVIGVTVTCVFKRSVLLGLLAGELAFVALALFVSRGGF
jgi:hypothetical protein